ncbi:MAG TPA: hypothetical protein VKZ85_04800 [Woeseiaceae bacterium]|nr:hypothetical protein [Woeseiaceae bacterium]
MSNRIKAGLGLLSFAALWGCASEPTYSPPEGPSMASSCPLGEVWVCRDHYPSRLEREEPPLHCVCENPSRVW